MAVTGTGGTAQHALGFVPHGQYLVPLDGYDGGLAQDDALGLTLTSVLAVPRSMPMS